MFYRYKMANYFCRISCEYELLRPVLEKFPNNIVVAYEHNHNVLNVHTHFLIEGMKESTDTLKNWIRKLTGRTFKADEWSFKTKYRPDKLAPEIPVNRGCITYMAKGKLEPQHVTGITMEDILDLKLKWIDYKRSGKQQALTSYIVKETQAKSKLRQDQMIQEIVKRLKEFAHPKEKDILQLIRQVVIVENKTIIGRYKVRDYFDTIIAIDTPNTWLNSMSSYVTFNNH